MDKIGWQLLTGGARRESRLAWHAKWTSWVEEEEEKEELVVNIFS